MLLISNHNEMPAVNYHNNFATTADLEPHGDPLRYPPISHRVTSSVLRLSLP